jgi:hypothetical protein
MLLHPQLGITLRGTRHHRALTLPQPCAIVMTIAHDVFQNRSKHREKRTTKFFANPGLS